MTVQGESPQRETLNTKRDLLDPKTTTRIGAWNVRTMYQVSKLAQVIKEMDRYNIGILGVSESRWTGTGKITTNEGYTIAYSGREDDNHKEGVAIIMNKASTKSLMEWEPISQRIIRARFNSSYCKLTIIQCYAPTNDAEEEVKDAFYEALQAQVSRTPQHDMLLITGDLNAKVGNNNSDHERSMGKEGQGTMNENGERLANFCSVNSLVIGGTIFKHKNIHKTTWVSPNGRDENQIDHIIINGKWRRSLQDTRAYRGADASSDHHLLAAKVRLKLKSTQQKKDKRKILDVKRLKEPEVKQKFVTELRNRFKALQDLDSEDEGENVVKWKWENIKKTYSDTSEKVIGYQRRNHKEWLTADTWKAIDERTKLKEKVINTRSGRVKEQRKREYREKDKEIKRKAKRDKKAFIEGKAKEAEDAAERGDLNTLYKITKELSGRKRQTPPVKDKSGKVISTEREQAARWVEHFQEVLNRPDPPIVFEGATPETDHQINTDPPTKDEIKKAIKAMKSGKAPGIDNINAELLKIDLETSATVLTDLFTKIWQNDEIPADWLKGLIVKLPKKGDLGNCDNWRGITLLSLPSKVFCKVLLNRIDTYLDGKLRQEQAGFRKGKGCIDQIFTLRNIIEQSLEWKAPLYVTFIDFKKAFDSIHRDTLWKILKSYGIPEKLVTLISCFYTNFECSILLDQNTTEWFTVNSGVRQGCIISPILFLVAIDWALKKTTSDRPRGIQWTLSSFLEDLDFADDIALLSSRRDHMQGKVTRLNSYGKQLGLEISIKKTQELRINTPPSSNITIDGEELDKVDEFIYLGGVASTEDSTTKDIKNRLRKARAAFQNLKHIWKSNQYNRWTKIKLYNSNVKSVLLYGSECWRVTKTDMKMLSTFHHGCLRRICKIFWPNKISNKDLLNLTNSTCIIEEVTKRRMRWLGHVLRMPDTNVAKTALRWTPQGKRPRGRPRNTWRRTVESELKKLGLTWGEAQKKAKDRAEWRSLVLTLCSTRSEED